MSHKSFHVLAVVLLGLLLVVLTACGEAPGVPHPLAGEGGAAAPPGVSQPAAGEAPAAATEGEGEEGLPPPDVDLAAIIKELEGVKAEDVPLTEGSVTAELVDFEFKPRLFRVEAGNVDFIFQNTSTHAHNYRVTAWDDHENIIYPGPKIGAAKTREVTIKLEPGVYYVLCNLSDHEQRGMVGKLIVEP